MVKTILLFSAHLQNCNLFIKKKKVHVPLQTIGIKTKDLTFFIVVYFHLFKLMSFIFFWYEYWVFTLEL